MAAVDYREEDVGNIVSLEHINIQVADQSVAMLFYVVGLGLTRDPYLNVGLDNMWINVGDQQFHLPTRAAQVIPGWIGLVVPDLEQLRARLKAVAERLSGTQFAWSAERDHVAVTCPWGNRFRCHAPAPALGDMTLGIPYVEFFAKPGAAEGIARFYQEVMGAPSRVESKSGRAQATVEIGWSQWLLFRETEETIRPYDGHHIAVYVANFSGPYGFHKRRNSIMEEARNHQFRFKELADPQSGAAVFLLEHEVRSLRHPMYHRSLINRNPGQSQRGYSRGRDFFVPGT